MFKLHIYSMSRDRYVYIYTHTYTLMCIYTHSPHLYLHLIYIFTIVYCDYDTLKTPGIQWVSNPSTGNQLIQIWKPTHSSWCTPKAFSRYELVVQIKQERGTGVETPHPRMFLGGTPIYFMISVICIHVYTHSPRTTLCCIFTTVGICYSIYTHMNHDIWLVRSFLQDGQKGKFVCNGLEILDATHGKIDSRFPMGVAGSACGWLIMPSYVSFIYTYVYMYSYVHRYIYMYIYTYINIHVYEYIYVNIYAYEYIYIHVNTYIYV